MSVFLRGPVAGHPASDTAAQATGSNPSHAPLQQEHHYVLPVGGPPLRFFLPLPLSTRDWTCVEGEAQRPGPGLPFSNRLARSLAHYCLSPGGVAFDPTDESGLAGLIDPHAGPVHERLRANALRLPRNTRELVRFRAAIGLSDLPLRGGPCWTGGGSIHESAWVYPPADFVPALMDDWFSFMWSSRHAWSFRFALGIPQFLRIHPFAAANGKTIRAFLIKQAQATGELDPVALALALMLQGRRGRVLALFERLYSCGASEYLEQVSHLAVWISDACRQEQGAGRSNQVPNDRHEPSADGFLGRFFAFSDELLFRSNT